MSKKIRYVALRSFDHEPRNGKHFHVEQGDDVPADLPESVVALLKRQGTIEPGDTAG